MGWGEPHRPSPKGAPMPDAPKDDLNPTALLAEALVLYRHLAKEPDLLQEELASGLAQIRTLAAIAQGAALLMPTPDEVIAAYRESTAEVLGEEAEKVAKAARILQEARSKGPRHPAIHAALEVLGE